MNRWIEELQNLVDRGEPAVLVTVAGVRGSAPRETGAKMIVTARHSLATIGGGQLEYQCTRIACGLLENGQTTQLRKFTLGANCGQCCGGVVEVLFERVEAGSAAWLKQISSHYMQRVPAVVVTDTASGNKAIVTAQTIERQPTEFALPESIVAHARALIAGRSPSAFLSDDDDCQSYFIDPILEGSFNVAVFGAGHVGTATVAALSRLDSNIRWVDSRRDIFPSLVLPNVTTIESQDPGREVAAMPAGSFFLVMTHSHALDFEICDRILQRKDFSYCGLIGSVSKKRRFERLMRQQGMSAAALERLTCPIGVAGIDGKRPEEIAIAVSAQLLQLRSAKDSDKNVCDENVIYVHSVNRQ